MYPHEAQRRIVITGMAGSGKSTFSRALAVKSGLPLIHLDLQFWKAGWTEPSEAEWREKQRGLLAGDAWIADGNYTETLDLRLEREQAIIARHGQHATRHVLRSERAIRDFLDGSVDVAGRGHGDGSS
jgi:broad-specificity NMP kinase